MIGGFYPNRSGLSTKIFLRLLFWSDLSRITDSPSPISRPENIYFIPIALSADESSMQTTPLSGPDDLDLDAYPETHEGWDRLLAALADDGGDEEVRGEMMEGEKWDGLE